MSHEGGKRVKRAVNLRKNRRTTVAGLMAGDEVRVGWNERAGYWQLLIESANGVTIRHVALTCAPPVK